MRRDGLQTSKSVSLRFAWSVCGIPQVDHASLKLPPPPTPPHSTPPPSTDWQLHKQLLRGYVPLCQHRKASSGEGHQGQVSLVTGRRGSGVATLVWSHPPRSHFVVTPGSEQIRATMERDGLVRGWAAAGGALRQGAAEKHTLPSPPSLCGRTSPCLPWEAPCWSTPVGPALGSGGGRMWRRERRTPLCPPTTATSLGGTTATPARTPLWPPRRCA